MQYHELGEGLLVVGPLEVLGRVDGEDHDGDQQPGGLKDDGEADYGGDADNDDDEGDDNVRDDDDDDDIRADEDDDGVSHQASSSESPDQQRRSEEPPFGPVEHLAILVVVCQTVTNCVSLHLDICQQKR